MAIYALDLDDDEWGHRFKYRIDATHPYKLPGVRCGGCGQTWAATGCSFPTVDLSPYEWATELYPHVADVAEFRRLAQLVQPLLPVADRAQPGWEIGPLRGRASGRVADLLWHKWSVLITEQARGLLEQHGAALPAHTPAALSGVTADVGPLYELEILPLATLAPESFSGDGTVCRVCGRHAVKLREPILSREETDRLPDLFRARYFSGLVFCSERFASHLTEAQLTGLSLREVETV